MGVSPLHAAGTDGGAAKADSPARLTGHLEKWGKMASKEEQPHRAVVGRSRFVVTEQLS